MADINIKKVDREVKGKLSDSSTLSFFLTTSRNTWPSGAGGGVGGGKELDSYAVCEQQLQNHHGHHHWSQLLGSAVGAGRTIVRFLLTPFVFFS